MPERNSAIQNPKSLAQTAGRNAPGQADIQVMAQNMLSLPISYLQCVQQNNFKSVCGLGNETNNPIRFIQEPVGFFINDLFVGREFKIKELRDRVKELELKIDNL